MMPIWFFFAFMFLLDNSISLHEELSTIGWLTPWPPNFHPKTTHYLIVEGFCLFFLVAGAFAQELVKIRKKLER
jgi:hypothetical protein